MQVQICDRDGSPRACWARSLAGVDARPLDRLLLVKPGNADELVVAGVLSSPNRARPANVIALQDGQSVLVQSSAGQSLLELSLHASGPVVKLLSDGVAVHLPGELSISAQSIALQARQGDVSIDAAEDVVVAGTTIRLN